MSGKEDGSKIRCAFHGEVISSGVVGIACAFNGDEKQSTSAVAGHRIVFKQASFSPQRFVRESICAEQRGAPMSCNVINAKALFIYCLLREVIASDESSDLCFPYLTTGQTPRLHQQATPCCAGSFFSLVKRVSRFNASFHIWFCTAKRIALQRDDTMAAHHSSTNDA